MNYTKTLAAAVLAGVMLAVAPVLADDAKPAATAAPAASATPAPAAATPAPAPATGGSSPAAPAGGPTISVADEPDIPLQSWSFSGIFGKYDQNQLRRGFQVFKEVCSNCHSAHLFAFRNLDEDGGPEYSAGQVKALAATYMVADPTVKGGKRPGLPSDYWPSPFASEQDARDANGGALPPDFSVLAKARGAERPLLAWMRDIVVDYQEGGPDYIHALLNGFHDKVPANVVNADGTPFKLPAGKYYNDIFAGHAIGMPPPLSDGLVKYAKGEDGSTVPETVEQYSHDVAAFMMWLSEPSLNQRKESGFRVILFLVLFAVIMWLVKRRIWSNVEGH